MQLFSWKVLINQAEARDALIMVGGYAVLLIVLAFAVPAELAGFAVCMALMLGVYAVKAVVELFVAAAKMQRIVSAACDLGSESTPASPDPRQARLPGAPSTPSSARQRRDQEPTEFRG